MFNAVQLTLTIGDSPTTVSLSPDAAEALWNHIQEALLCSAVALSRQAYPKPPVDDLPARPLATLYVVNRWGQATVWLEEADARA